MKCYFACNDRSSNYDVLIKGLVNSAQKNTTLDLYCIYDGNPNALTAWLEVRGVNVIFHRSSFYDALEKHCGDNIRKLNTASGAFLRCDIPILEQEDDYVLYVDCDVIFNKDVDFSSLERPEYFSCSQEINKDDWENFNTGVMYMNIKNLRATYEGFCEYIVNNFDKLYTFDQTAYQFYYGREKLTMLPEIYNHKPYWGINKDAVIIHFHGSKPYHFTPGHSIQKIPIYKWLLTYDIEAYIYYLRMFKLYLPEIKYKSFLRARLTLICKCYGMRGKVLNFMRQKCGIKIGK